MRVRVGVIGTSWWSDAMYLPALADHPEAHVVAVCGRSKATAQQFAQQWKIPAAFDDAESMFNEVPLDAVVIATSNDSHYPLALMAIERGIHVLCEKPLALNVAQALEMTRQANTRKLITMVPFTYHYMPVNQWVKRLIDQGFVGRPLHINARYYTSFGFDPQYSWRFDPQVAGSGIIGDLGSHWIHLSRWLLGAQETSVSATARTFVPRGPRPDGAPYHQLEDSAAMTVSYDTGAYGLLHVSAVCWEGTPFGQSHHLEIHGDAGTIYATCDWDTVQEVRGVKAGESGGAKLLPIPNDIWNASRRETVHNTYRDVFRSSDAMTRQWITAIAAGQQVTPDFDEGLDVQRVVDAAAISAAQLGAPVRISHQRPPDVHVLAIDHRWQMEDLFDDAQVGHERIPELKALLFESFRIVANVRNDLGILLDEQYSSELIHATEGMHTWVARAIDVPKSRPVELICGPHLPDALRQYSPGQIIKVMVYAHPEDPAELMDLQWQRVARLSCAAAAAQLPLLVEFQSPAGVAPGPDYLPRMLTLGYENGIRPTWWKLPPIDEVEQWHAAADVIANSDPSCLGMLVLGQSADPSLLAAAMSAAATEPMVRGFAIGRAIFSSAVQRWLRGELDDDGLVSSVAERFTETIDIWQRCRS